MSTHAIVINWRRPDNIGRIVAALLAQTKPIDKITIVDNSPNGSLISNAGRKVSVWYFPDDGIGPVCRFAPALLHCKYDYTMFVDDDLVPGRALHEQFLATARVLDNKFATIGDVARIYRQTGSLSKPSYYYVMSDVPRHDDKPRVVDLTCRGHFIRTSDVRYALEFRDKLRQNYTDDDWLKHDDILLCCGIQLFTGKPSYLLPTVSPHKKHRLVSTALNDDNAMSRQSNHHSVRNTLITRATSIGWRSLVSSPQVTATHNA